MIAPRFCSLAVLLATVMLLGADNAQLATQIVTLSGGTKVNAALMHVDFQALEQSFVKGSTTYERQARASIIIDNAGAFTLRGGKLSGPSIYLNRNGSFAAIARYSVDALNGELRIWDGPEPRIFARYKSGALDGLRVYFVGGLPAFAETFKDGMPTGAFAIEDQGGVLVALPEKSLTDQQKKRVKYWRAELEKTSTVFAGLEKRARKSIQSSKPGAVTDALRDVKAIIQKAASKPHASGIGPTHSRITPP